MFDLNQLLEDREKDAIIWLWNNRALLEERFQNDDYLFDYPDYGGMSEDLLSTLSTELVDWVQENTQLGFPTNQLSFMRQAIKAQLY